MAEFKSRYQRFTFWHDGQARKFAAGRYVTEDAQEIETLGTFADVERVDEEKPATKRKQNTE